MLRPFFSYPSLISRFPVGPEPRMSSMRRKGAEGRRGEKGKQKIASSPSSSIPLSRKRELERTWPIRRVFRHVLASWQGRRCLCIKYEKLFCSVSILIQHTTTSFSMKRFPQRPCLKGLFALSGKRGESHSFLCLWAIFPLHWASGDERTKKGGGGGGGKDDRGGRRRRRGRRGVKTAFSGFQGKGSLGEGRNMHPTSTSVGRVEA